MKRNITNNRLNLAAVVCIICMINLSNASGDSDGPVNDNLLKNTSSEDAALENSESESSSLQNTLLLRSVPENVRAKYISAVWAARLGDINMAIMMMNQIVSDHPDFAHAYLNLGLLYLQQQELVAAEQSLVRAVKLNAQDAVAFNHLGVVLRKLGKFKQAEAAYSESLRINSRYPDALLNKGILYDLYLHDAQKALELYKQYQVLRPNENKSVTKWIIELERRLQRDS